MVPDAGIHDCLHHEIEMCHDCGTVSGENAPRRDSLGDWLQVIGQGADRLKNNRLRNVNSGRIVGNGEITPGLIAISVNNRCVISR